MNPEIVGERCRVAFEGRLGEILKRHVAADVAGARLSPKFKIYYGLRPLIPILLRQLIQRRRNRALDVAPNWYLPKSFLREWRSELVQQVTAAPASRVVHPWPHSHTHAAVMTHDIETAEGLYRVDAIAKIEEECGIRSAWFVIPHKYKLDYGLLDALRERGHEIGIHGYNHDGRLFTSQRLFSQRAKAINAAGQGLQAAGFRAPMVHRNLQWMQQLEFDYDASCFDIDPFQAMPGGVGGPWPFIYGNLVELPYTLPQDHTLFALGESTARIWLEKYALIRQLRGLALLITHPDYLNNPSRLEMYRRGLEHFTAAQDAWKCLPSEVVSWWRTRDASTMPVGIQERQPRGTSEDCGRMVSLQTLFQEFLDSPHGHD